MDKFFNENLHKLLQMQGDLGNCLRFCVTNDPTKQYKLFIWLIRLLIMASNPNEPAHFKIL